MSTYSTIYQALTTGKPMSPADAAALLAAHRRELGDELANGLIQHAREQYPHNDRGTASSQRIARRAYSATSRAADWVRRTTATGRRTTTPNPRRAS